MRVISRQSLRNGQVAIIGYSGSAEDVHIPDRINGRPVISIGDYAFADTSLTSVTIPNSVTSICHNMLLKMIFMSEIRNPPFWNSLPSGKTLVFSSKNYMPCGILSNFYIFFSIRLEAESFCPVCGKA
jgi:hypothetical protein